MLFSKSRDPHGMHRLLRQRLGRAIGDCQALLRHVAVVNSSGLLSKPQCFVARVQSETLWKS